MGSTMVPLRWIQKSQWEPLEMPVEPMAAMVWPLYTWSPTET